MTGFGEQTVTFESTYEAGNTTCETVRFHSTDAEGTTSPQSLPEGESSIYTTEEVTGEYIVEGCTNTLLGAMENNGTVVSANSLPVKHSKAAQK